ncbi:conserved hypothetical protein [Desulfamplus magnetovallimortis]|uniref:Uncharacterized protein n=1 Tax=Desulfamplus magnetovallimortis TaxID=1246637 RepID=A0A1W1HBK3_9BACT|nr:hypothetical protein [Desulfamplus magnetovallimortis]SLM29874.1 conserved hypothetical protein [Desulfamplus magnetovallimortis]
MTNKYKKHLLILPEDDANRQVANGFLLCSDLNDRNIQVLPPSGGWIKALSQFKSNHINDMRKYDQRRMLILIDFDGDENRFEEAQKDIPNDVSDRVFILGSFSETEELKKKIPGLNSYETIGKALAKDCVNETNNIWGHDLLKHNQDELDRMVISVKPFLFH